MKRLLMLLAVVACGEKTTPTPTGSADPATGSGSGSASAMAAAAGSAGSAGAAVGSGSAMGSGSAEGSGSAAGSASGAGSAAGAGSASGSGSPAPIHPAVRDGKRMVLTKHSVPASVIVPAGFKLNAEDAGEGVYNVFLRRGALKIRISNIHGCDDAYEVELAKRRNETSVHDEALAAGHVRLWRGKAYRIDTCISSGNSGLYESATCSAMASSLEDAELVYAICRSLELVVSD